MNKLAGRIAALLLNSALLLAIPAAANAAESALLREGEGLARSGRCEEAIPVLERARAADPADAVVLHVLGQCQIRLADYPSAAATLDAARQLDPNLPEIDLQLGIARYHSEDLDGAEAAFAEARRRGGSGASAELDLYEGLLQLERGAEPSQAAESLERARQLDRALVEPIASYYAGVAWMTADDEARARVALERVVREAPGTQWASAAQRILDDPAGAAGQRGMRDRRDLNGEEQAERPLGSMAELHRPDRWLLLSGGLEWDSNVTLGGKGVEILNVVDEDDGRGVWSAQGGMQIVETEDWTVGALAAYYGTAYFNENDFNVHYPSISPWVDRRIGDNTTLRLQYDFSYAWVGGDSFLLSNGFLPALYHNWGRAGTSRFQADIFYDDYKYDRLSFPQADSDGNCTDGASICSPFGVDVEKELNADGLGAFFGPSHSIGVDSLDTEFYGGYRFLYYESKGSEYSYRGHEFQLGSRSLLPFEFMLDLRARYAYKPYQHPSVLPISAPEEPLPGDPYTAYPTPSRDRTDHVFEIVAIIERQITDHVFGSIRCNYLNNDSNTPVYDYDRILVGGFVTVRFFN